jgi:nucleotide-binding universal stress UspA family protein
VVGYDGSDASRRALGRAAELADEGATVVAVHAAASVYGDAAPGPADPDEEARAEVLLQEARQLLGDRGVEAEVRTPVGPAAEALVAAAKEIGAELIVVGRRRSPAAHLLGSVSSKVVREAACDVLVVR